MIKTFSASLWNRKASMLFLSVLVTLSLIISACGGGTSNNSGGTTQPPAQTGDNGTDTETPDEGPKELTKASMVIAVNTLSFAPIFVAEKLGYYEDEGVDMQLILVEGTGPAIQALVGGSAEFAAVDSGGTVQPFEKGAPVMSIQANVNKMTMDFALSNDALEKTGITADTPIEEKFKAMEGLMIGITSPGAATDLFTRYYLNQAGLKPEVDTRLLAVGAGPSLSAALKSGQIDGFMLSPPAPQQLEAGGDAKIVISASTGEVPGLDNFPYEVINVTKTFAEKDPETVRAVARALARANNLLIDDLDAAVDALAQHFDQVDPEILKAGTASVANAVPRDGLMNEDGWKNAVEIYKMTGMISEDLDTTEGVMWTNEFLK